MKNLWIALGVCAAAVLLLAVIAIGVRNGLITRDETVRENWSQIDTQLQRRTDLIPNLVATVKGYAKHEQEIFTSVAAARGKLLAAGSPEAKASAETELRSSLGRLLAIAEKYPDLKANTTFIRLQDELAGTENRISVARGRYNLAVRDFNSAIRRFPGSLFAPGLNFKPAEYFQVADRAAAQKVPEVRF